MASQNIARLGVVLGVDTAEFTAGIEEAIRKQKQFASSIRSDSNAAAREIAALKYATDNYNKSLTKTEEIEYRISKGNLAYATDKLKQELLAQAKAYDAVAASAKKANEAKVAGMFGGKDSTAISRQQMAALGYQTTDIITGLAGGQNPLLVLIQQGGQLRDQFGSVKGVFEAFARVLTPTKLLVGGLGAAVGALGYSFYKGAEESARIRDSLILTGNIAGIVNNKFDVLSKTLSTQLNTSIGASREIFASLIASGKFTQETMTSVAQAIAMVSKLSGESADVVSKELIGSFDGSASSAKKLNDQYNFLNVAQYRYIEQLNQQGKLQEAAKYTADLLTESLAKQERNLGLIEKMLSGAKNAWSAFWDAAFDIGRDKTTSEKLADLAKDIEYYGKESPNANTKFREVRLKKLKQALEDYNKLSQEMLDENDRVNAVAAQKAKDRADIEARIKAGGLQKEQSLESEYRKQISNEGFQSALESANEIQRVRFESFKKIAEVALKYEEQMLQSGNVFGEAITRNMRQQVDAITKEADQKMADISRLRQREIEQRQTSDANSVAKEKEKLELYRENIFLSDTDYKIALDRLRTEQEIAKIMSDERLSPEAREALANRERQIQSQREGVERLGESLKMLRDINQAVFQNMTDALTNFIMTGKLNFRNFAATVLMEIARINAAAVAAQASRGIMGVLGNIVGNMFSTQLGNLYQASTGITVDDNGVSLMVGRKAGGGDILGGQPVLVGDAGPELFVPRNAGTIVPNSQLASSMPMGNQVTNYYIDAIDTKSFEERVLQSHNAVWAANQYANKSLPLSRGRA